jgi:hypothetical protein
LTSRNYGVRTNTKAKKPMTVRLVAETSDDPLRMLLLAVVKRLTPTAGHASEDLPAQVIIPKSLDELERAIRKAAAAQAAALRYGSMVTTLFGHFSRPKAVEECQKYVDVLHASARAAPGFDGLETAVMRRFKDDLTPRVFKRIRGLLVGQGLSSAEARAAPIYDVVLRLEGRPPHRHANCAAKRRPGRRPIRDHDPKRFKEERAFYKRWQMSDSTQKDFVRDSGLDLKEGMKMLSRGKHYARQV